MTTQTPLSAARSSSFQPQAPSLQNVYPELRRAHPSNRLAALIQFLRATDRGSRATEILIANLELEFRPTHRKISSLRISNRKYLAIFHLTSQSRCPTSPNFQSGNPFGSAPLVYPELRRAQLYPELRRAHPRKPLTSPRAALRVSSLRFSPATGHSSLITAFLIYGSAIRNRRKALKT